MLTRVRQLPAQLNLSAKPFTRQLSTTSAKMVRPGLVLMRAPWKEILTVPQTEGKITNWVAAGDKSGEFKRGQSQFRNFIKKGGEFPPEVERYHLYVSYACPWGM